jgi:hypothetical protein
VLVEVFDGGEVSFAERALIQRYVVVVHLRTVVGGAGSGSGVGSGI